MLRLVGTRLDEGWLGHFQRIQKGNYGFKICVCGNMNVHVHKNRAMSRCAGERRDVLESHIFNVTTFLRVIFSMS